MCLTEQLIVPYTEEKETCPNSVYGTTKLAGEQNVMDHCEKAVVIRTAWLYSIYGNNFVKTMIRLGRRTRISWCYFRSDRYSDLCP